MDSSLPNVRFDASGCIIVRISEPIELPWIGTGSGRRSLVLPNMGVGDKNSGDGMGTALPKAADGDKKWSDGVGETSPAHDIDIDELKD